MKMKKTEIKQDLTLSEKTTSIFIMRLFMKENEEMPSQKQMTTVMKKHLGKIKCLSYNSKIAGFASLEYKTNFKEKISPQLLVTDCHIIEKDLNNELQRIQMWNGDKTEKFLSECKYEIIANDLLGSTMEYQERADMLMNYLEALIELYPACQAIYFPSSQKIISANEIYHHKILKKDRFIYFVIHILCISYTKYKGYAC